MATKMQVITNVTNQNQLTAEDKTFYERALLERLLPELQFYKDAMKKKLPKNQGRTINFRRFNSLTAPGSSLTEGVTPDGNDLSVTAITATVAQEGDWVSISILRAGLIFSDIANEIMPYATVRHIGMYRDEETLTPIWYYNKIPIEFENPENKIILILDPMLATGNSAIDAIKLFVNKNVPEKNIRFVSLISAPEGLEKVTALYPDVQIVTANIDECLNEMGYIRPGLGDAGDRIFNTVEN